MTTEDDVQKVVEDIVAKACEQDPLPSSDNLTLPPSSLNEAEKQLDDAANRKKRLVHVILTPGNPILKRARTADTPDQATPAKEQVTLNERLCNADPIPIGPGKIDWNALTATFGSELLNEEKHAAEDEATPEQGSKSAATPRTPKGGTSFDHNSGGCVLFCFFKLEATAAEAPPADSSPTEGCMVLKFCGDQQQCQSEQFANELAHHVGICSPHSRILRSDAGDGEWAAALAAAERLSDHGLKDQMNACKSLLVIEFVPGKRLFQAESAFGPATAAQTFEDLGRLFALDMLLGNSDRLKSDAMGWKKGNPGNVLWASAGRWQGRLVAIDAVVQWQPPGTIESDEIAEIALKDVLEEAISISPVALEAMAADPSGAVAAFQRGMESGLEILVNLKGMLQKIFDATSAQIDALLQDCDRIASLDGPSPGSADAGNRPTPTAKRSRSESVDDATPASKRPRVSIAGTPSALKRRRLCTADGSASSVDKRLDGWVKEFKAKGEGDKVLEWQKKFGETVKDLRGELERWQTAGSSGDQPHQQMAPTVSTSTPSKIALTTGFLDGSLPVKDTRGLKARTENLLRRLKMLEHPGVFGLDPSKETMGLPFGLLGPASPLGKASSKAKGGTKRRHSEIGESADQ